MEWVRKYQNLWKKIGIAVAVGLAMKYLAPLVIPFLIAGAIVYWCRPLLAWLKKRLHIRPAHRGSRRACVSRSVGGSKSAYSDPTVVRVFQLPGTGGGASGTVL